MPDHGCPARRYAADNIESPRRRSCGASSAPPAVARCLLRAAAGPRNRLRRDLRRTAPARRPRWRQRLSRGWETWGIISADSVPERPYMYSREPRIHPVPMTLLRPTQITVGMREVKSKRRSWRNHPDRKKPDFLGKHLIPVIWGPKEEYYVIDHHHLALALHQEGVENIATTVV